MKHIQLLSVALAALALSQLIQPQSALAQTTAFTYQGRLDSDGNPATGSYDLRFALFDAASSGAQQGVALTNIATGVSNGLFTVTLDFGNQFPGANRWLEIGVRTNGGGAFTTLNARQLITATPYATRAANAGSVAAANVTGTMTLVQLPSSLVTNGAIGVNLTGTFSGNGAGLTNLNASQLTSGTVADGRLSANVSLFGAGVDSAEITDGVIGNADINAAAAIADTKLATISTAGKVADTALSANIARRAGGNAFTGNQVVTGGSVGIGTNNPQTDLDVIGDGQTVLVRSTTAGWSSFLEFNNASSMRGIIGADGVGFSGGANQFSIATWTSHPIKFFTAATERMAISTNGNVGIGTNNPAVPLQVVGAATWPGGAGPARGAITGTQTSGDAFSAGVAGVSQVPGAYGVVGVSDTLLTGVSGPGTANIGVGGNSSTTNGTGVYGYAGASSGRTFGVVGDAPSAQGYAGYFMGRGYFSTHVGIGNSAPSRLLHIGGPPGTEGLIRLESTSTNGVAQRIWDVGVPKDNVSAVGKFFSFVIDDAQLGTEPELLIKYGTGNVGIGTTNPLAKLDVNGSVRATSFDGNAGSLTNLNASQLTSGTVPLARLPAGLVTNGASGVTLSGTFSGNGAGLTNLNATQITSGTLADARLSPNVALLDRANQWFTGGNTFNNVGIRWTNRLDFGLGHSAKASNPNSAYMEYVFIEGPFSETRLDIFGSGITGVGNDRVVKIRDTLFVETAAGQALIAGGLTPNVGVKRMALTNPLEVEGNASKTTAGDWLANSDARIKQDIQPIAGALEKLNQVRLVSFQYTDQYRKEHPSIGTQRYLNVVAQEFAKVFPDHVQSSKEKLPDGSEILQADTYPLTIYSAAAVQELSRKLEQKDAQIANLEARLEKLEQLLGNRLDRGAR